MQDDAVVSVPLTGRQRNIAAYALAYYANALAEHDSHATYVGPLETEDEVRELEDFIRRAR